MATPAVNSYQQSIGIAGWNPQGQPIDANGNLWIGNTGLPGVPTGYDGAPIASGAPTPAYSPLPPGYAPPPGQAMPLPPGSKTPVFGTTGTPTTAPAVSAPASLTSLAPGTQATGLAAGSNLSGLPPWLTQFLGALNLNPAGSITQPFGSPAAAPSPAPTTPRTGAGGFSLMDATSPAARQVQMSAVNPGISADSASSPGTTPASAGTPGASPTDVSSIVAPSWLQGLVNYGLPIAATLYGGLNLASAFGNAGQTEANAYQGAGNEVAGVANQAAQGIESAAGAGAQGILGAGATAIGATTPYTAAGSDAINRLNNSSFSFNPDMMTADPGYQFRLAQGQQALQAAAAANGGALSGNTLEALTNYNQGFASNEFQNAYNRALQGYLTNLGQQQNLAGLGLGATQYAGNTGLTAAEGAGQLGYQGALESGNFGLSGSTYQGNANSAAGTALGSTGIGAGEAEANMANQIAQILMSPPPSGGLNLAQLLSQL